MPIGAQAFKITLPLFAPTQDDTSRNCSTNDDECQDIVLAEQTTLLTGTTATCAIVTAATGCTTCTLSLALGGAGAGRAATRSGTIGAIARRSTLTIVSAVTCGDGSNQR